MQSTKQSGKLDNVGMAASVLCAIHCAAVPLLLTSLPLIGLGFLANPFVELGMILFAAIIGAYAIGKSTIMVHRQILPLLLLLIGFLILIMGHLYLTGWHEAVLVPIGGLTIATAHLFNFRYSRRCTH